MMCYSDWLKDWRDPEISNSVAGKTPLDWKPAAQKDFEALAALDSEAAIAFVTSIEKDNTCAGMCQKGLFYVTLGFGDDPVRPSKRCIEGVLEDFITAKPALRVVVATGAISAALWVIQFVLWFKYKD